MTKTLTEVITFVPTVDVPEGDDDMSLAAESIEAIAQALANRTRALKAICDIAALNIGDQFFNGRVSSNRQTATKAGFRVGYGPHDDPGHAFNRWSLAFEATLVGAVEFRIYQGDGAEGWIALTVNASYDSEADTPSWTYDDASKKAYALMLSDISGVAPWIAHSYQGADHWTVWDNLSARFQAHNMVADDFVYINAAPHSERVNIAQALGAAFLNTSTGAIHFVPDLADTYPEIAFPLPLKRDTVVSYVAIDMNHAVSSSTSDLFTLRRRAGALGSVSYEDVAHVNAAAGVGRQTRTITPAPFTVVRGEEYWLVWKIDPSDPAVVSGSAVYAIDINCTQAGPRP